MLFLGLTTLVIVEFTSAREFGQALTSAIWYWMVVSALLFVVSFYLYALLYRVGLEAVEVRFKDARPARPAHGLHLLEHGGSRRRGHLRRIRRRTPAIGARAAAGVILVLVVDLATTLPFVVGGLAFLHSQGKLPSYYVVVSALFVLVILLFVTALWLAKVRRSWLETLLRWCSAGVESGGTDVQATGVGSETWAAQKRRPVLRCGGIDGRTSRSAGLSVVVGLLFHLVNAVGLYTLFLAFGQHVAVGTVTAGFSMSIVLYVIAVTPQGVGATEGVMSLLFTSMGVPAAIAVAVAVSYRVFNVWIPIGARLPASLGGCASSAVGAPPKTSGDAVRRCLTGRPGGSLPLRPVLDSK